MLSYAALVTLPDRTSLKQRVLNAGVWTLAGYGLNQAIRFGSNLLMTRLLVPEMFGVMAIATMVMVALAMFSDVGLKQSVIQSKRGNDRPFLNTAWVTQILRGALLWFLALNASLLLVFAHRTGIVPKDSVYSEPSLPYVIAILSFGAVIAGAESTKLFEASRNLSLAAITKIDITSQIAGLLCMVGWVSVDRSIWAMVAGGICSALVRAILSHFWLPGSANRWQWDYAAFSEIIHFGKWIFVASILGFLVNNGDRLLLGGLFNTNIFGVYVVAYLIFNSVEQVLTRIIGEVSFPALSEVARERPAELKQSHYRFHTVIGVFAYFCTGLLIAFAQSLTGLLYDPRYEQAGWMLQVLAATLLTVPFRIAAVGLLALGLSRLHSHILVVRVITLFLLVPLGSHFFGTQGGLLGIVASYFSSLPPTIFYQIKYKFFDLRKELLLLPAIPAGMLLAAGLNLALSHKLH